MERGLLSTRAIPRQERLIFPLDVPDLDEARRWVARLGDAVHFYKLGLELFVTGNALGLADELAGNDKQVFLDLKLFDVPATVAGAVRQLRGRRAWVTVHGNDAILEAACREKGELSILAVTVLTSLDRGDLGELGFGCDIPELVLSRARRALRIGCDGIVSSGFEVPAIRAELGGSLIVVTPGIRPVENRELDDQKRVMTPREAFLAGADYIVVGRPIRSAADPRAAALRIQDTIADLFA